MQPHTSDTEMISYGCGEAQASHSHVSLPSLRKLCSDNILLNLGGDVELKELIHTLQRSLQQNCDEIRFRRDALERLEQRHQHLQALLDQTCAFLSPIRTMPTEILSLIFDYLCYNIGFSDRARPIVLASVCYRWRSIAISYPSIWTCINTPRHSPHTDGLARSFVQLYLDRSQDMPIRIHVSDFPFGSPDSTLLSTLAAHAHRWSRATLTLTSDGYNTLFRALEGKSLPLLRKFCLYGPSLDGVPEVFPCAALMTAHNLDRLVFQKAAKHPEILGLSLEKIRMLSLIDQDDSASILRCIAQTINLRYIRITATSEGRLESRGLIPEVVVAAEALHLSLRMGNFSGGLFENVLSILSTPALRHLKLALPLLEECPTSCSPRLDGIFRLKSVSDFIVRSGCRLRSLRIENVNIHENDLIQVLEKAPTITTLVLHELHPGVVIPTPRILIPQRWITDKLLRCLTITPKVPIILPRLKHLDILLSCRMNEVEEDLLLRMAASRLNPDLPNLARLKRLYFASQNGVESYPWLSGGRVRLHKPPKRA